MNKIIVFIAFLCLSNMAQSQTTYYWVGGLNSSYNTSTNWNSNLNGSGVSRTTPVATDILALFISASLSLFFGVRFFKKGSRRLAEEL